MEHVNTPPEIQSTKSDRHPCEAALRGGSTWNHYTYACGKTAKVEREGKWYCGTHDPVAVSARQAKRDQARDEKWAERTRTWKLEQAAPDLLEAAQLAVGALSDVEAIGWSPSVDPKRWAAQCAAPLKAAIAKAEGR